MAALDFPSSPTVGQVYTANGKSWQWDGVSWISYNTLIAAGSNTQIQFNNSGAFGASSNLTWNGSTLATTGFSASGAVNLSGGTANGVAYLNASKVLTTGTALTFDGTSLKVVGTYDVNQTNLFEINNGQTGATKFASGASLTSDSGGNYTSAFYVVSGSDTRYNLITGSPTTVSLYSANTEQARITANGLGIGYTSLTGLGSNGLAVAGNVGIGTSSPAAKLDIYQTAAVNSQLYLRNNGTYHTGFLGSSSATPLSDAYAWGMFGGPNNYLTGVADAVSIALGASVPNFLITRNNNLNSGPIATLLNLTSSGNLGLGVTPSVWATAGTSFKAFELGYAGNSFAGQNGASQVSVSSNCYYTSGWKYANSSVAAAQYYQTGGNHYWQTAASGAAGATILFNQTMTLTAAGDLLVGCTSAPSSTVFGWSVVGPSGYRYIASSAADAGSRYHATFLNPNGMVGRIETSGTATAYITSSDYRLKENVKPIQNALSRVALLKPSTYNWKTDGSDGEGFIAHELQEVVPQAVSGEKDGDEMQGVDYGKLTPLLAAAIQELHAEIKSLKAKVN